LADPNGLGLLGVHLRYTKLKKIQKWAEIMEKRATNSSRCWQAKRQETRISTDGWGEPKID